MSSLQRTFGPFDHRSYPGNGTPLTFSCAGTEFASTYKVQLQSAEAALARRPSTVWKSGYQLLVFRCCSWAELVNVHRIVGKAAEEKHAGRQS